MSNKFLITILSLFVSVCSIANDYLITDYGAVGDGKTLCTIAIQTAIDDAHKAGGGKVVVPRGIFISGSINLKSNVNLFISKRGQLWGSLNPDDYRRVGKWRAFIMAEDETNISISGKGIINGRGDKVALQIDSLFYVGQLDSADYNLKEGRSREYMRPLIIRNHRCSNVSVTGVTIKNSACWVQSYNKCDGLTLKGITVYSDAYWNNDGIDIVDSKNVRVTDCNINAADDGICIKTEDRKWHGVSENIYIANCTVRSSASAVKIGTSTMNDIRNVVIKNIKVYDTYRSAIAIEAMQEGVVENIHVENIKATNTGNAIFLRVGQIRGAKTEGVLKNVTIKNVTVRVPFERPDYDYIIRGPELPFFHNVFPSSITGVPGNPIHNVTLENIKIIYPGRGRRAYANMPISRLEDVPEAVHKYPEFSMFGELPAWGFYVRHVDGLTLKNVKIKIKDSDYRPAIVYDDVLNLEEIEVAILGDVKKVKIIYKDTVK